MTRSKIRAVALYVGVIVVCLAVATWCSSTRANETDSTARAGTSVVGTARPGSWSVPTTASKSTTTRAITTTTAAVVAHPPVTAASAELTAELVRVTDGFIRGWLLRPTEADPFEWSELYARRVAALTPFTDAGYVTPVAYADPTALPAGAAVAVTAANAVNDNSATATVTVDGLTVTVTLVRTGTADWRVVRHKAG